jgi:hypothetical protein
MSVIFPFLRFSYLFFSRAQSAEPLNLFCFVPSLFITAAAQISYESFLRWHPFDQPTSMSSFVFPYRNTFISFIFFLLSVPGWFLALHSR